MGGIAMIRLVNQFDPPTRHASVATATCSSCCCCCCCCVVSGVGVTTFAVMNMSASAKLHDKGTHGAWSVLRPIIVVGLSALLLPIIGAASVLSVFSSSDGTTNNSGVIVFSIVMVLILGSVLAAFYRSTGEAHPIIAGFTTAGVGALISVGEAFLVLYGLFGAGTSSGFVFIVYVLLVVAGLMIAVHLGPRVKWLQH